MSVHRKRGGRRGDAAGCRPNRERVAASGLCRGRRDIADGVVDPVGSRSGSVRGGGAESPTSIEAAPGPGTGSEHLPTVVDCRRRERSEFNSRLTAAFRIYI